VPSFQKRIGEKVAALSPPGILLTDNLGFRSPDIFDSSDVTGNGIRLTSTVSLDLLPSLSKSRPPAILEGKVAFQPSASLQAFDLSISSRVSDVEQFPIGTSIEITNSSLDHPVISTNLFEALSRPVVISGSAVA